MLLAVKLQPRGTLDSAICYDIMLWCYLIECGVLCRFGIKEEWMEFMNAFVSREFDNMRTFLQNISVKHSARDVGLYLSRYS